MEGERVQKAEVSAAVTTDDAGLGSHFDRFFSQFDEFLALEDQIAPFNLFEAVGMQRAEIRHSQFLAYILDPRRRHGIGDRFLKRFLYRALAAIGSSDPHPAEAMVANLEGAVVERERENIDILVTVEAEQLVVALENKIDAGETGDQLTRYHDWLERAFPDPWRRVRIFLSPNGKLPSHAGWAALDYACVVDALRWTLETESLGVSRDVDLALRHYRDMLERNVLDEDRNREIARKLYHKHKEVFDFVFASLPQPSDTILTRCMEAVGERGDVFPINQRGFKSTNWRGLPIIGEDAGEAAQALYFEILPASETKLVLYLGPAPSAFREDLHEAARAAGEPFAPRADLTPTWTQLLRETLLSRSETASLTLDDAGALAARRLATFLDERLGGIDRLVTSVVRDSNADF